MEGKWISLDALRDVIAGSVKSDPSVWFYLLLSGKKGHRLMSGSEILLMDFGIPFFDKGDSSRDIDFSWLIRSSLGRRGLEGVLKKSLSGGLSFRHPLVRHESAWVGAILELDRSASVYARYEGDDVLVFGSNSPSGCSA